MESSAPPLTFTDGRMRISRASLLARMISAHWLRWSVVAASLAVTAVGLAGDIDTTKTRQAEVGRPVQIESRVARRLSVAPALPSDEPVQLCQVLTPADPNPIPAVDCFNTNCGPCAEAGWGAMGPVEGFQEWAQGEYVGRARISHVP